MYLQAFGLTKHPFNMTPDPQFLFLSHNHRIALDVLRFGIRDRKGFIVITGEIGAGKTTVCRSLLRSLDANTKMGPMIRERDAQRVAQWVDEAVASGARLVAGGSREGTMFAPTLLADRLIFQP